MRDPAGLDKVWDRDRRQQRQHGEEHQELDQLAEALWFSLAHSFKDAFFGGKFLKA